MKNDHIDDLVQLGTVLELVTSASTFRKKVNEAIEILKDLDVDEVDAPTLEIRKSIDLLSLARWALRYLEHPEVQAIPFATPTSEITASLRKAIKEEELKLVRLRFETKSPADPLTWFIHLWVPKDSELTDFYAALESAGFNQGAHPSTSTPSLNGEVERYFHRKGSNFFYEWTTQENKKFLEEVMEVLERFGFHTIQFHRLTLQECM